MDDLHDLLAGGQALEDVGADGPLAHAGHEVLDHLEVDVGLEEGEADLAHRRIDVGLGHAAATVSPASVLRRPSERVSNIEGMAPCGDRRDDRPAVATRVLATRVMATPKPARV